VAPTVPFDKIYTRQRNSGRLGVARRTMIKLGRDLGSCSKIGDEYLLSEAIWQAQRAMPTSSQGGAVNVKGFMSDVRLLRSLASLTQKKRGRP